MAVDKYRLPEAETLFPDRKVEPRQLESWSDNPMTAKVLSAVHRKLQDNSQQAFLKAESDFLFRKGFDAALKWFLGMLGELEDEINEGDEEPS